MGGSKPHGAVCEERMSNNAFSRCADRVISDTQANRCVGDVFERRTRCGERRFVGKEDYSVSEAARGPRPPHWSCSRQVRAPRCRWWKRSGDSQRSAEIERGRRTSRETDLDAGAESSRNDPACAAWMDANGAREFARSHGQRFAVPGWDKIQSHTLSSRPSCRGRLS